MADFVLYSVVYTCTHGGEVGPESELYAKAMEWATKDGPSLSGPYPAPGLCLKCQEKAKENLQKKSMFETEAHREDADHRR